MVTHITSPVDKEILKGGQVFLSASFPSPNRSQNYYETARPFEITDAVLAAARAVLGAGGKLVFGGHPTISPLILSVAREFLPHIAKEERPFVRVFQLENYRDQVPKETLRLEQLGVAEIDWSPAVGDLTEGLVNMRKSMLLRTSPIAAIFIGGMEGVYDPNDSNCEFKLFLTICPGKPAYPIPLAGGASRILYDAMTNNRETKSGVFVDGLFAGLADPNLAYPFLMQTIVLDIAEHLKRSSQ